MMGGKKGKKSTVAVASDSEDEDMENNSEPEEGMMYKHLKFYQFIIHVHGT